MLPTFLGIGAPRAGTTWIHQLLARHPDVVVPAHRKELHYFDLHFERGTDWYAGFFPDGDPGGRAVGEFTPHYLYAERAPERVRSVSSIERFLVILRNPVDRAYSHYRFRRTQDNRTESFEEFLRQEPAALEWGLYGRHLARWLDAFGRRPFLVLLFEEAVRNPDATRSRIAGHIGVDAERFPPDAGMEAANPSVVLRRRRMYASAVRQARWLRRHDLDRVITLAKRTGVVEALKRPAPGRQVPSDEHVSDELRRRLWAQFEPDVTRLEAVTGLDLSAWRPEAA